MRKRALGIKIFLAFLLMGSFGKGLAQKKHKDHLFNLVLETQIQPFLMDSSGTGKTEWENENFVTVYADMRNAVLKTWPLQNGDVLVGLLLNDPDMVMNHQQNRFFFYRNEQL